VLREHLVGTTPGARRIDTVEILVGFEGGGTW
jgi:hypothetical protein